MVNCRKSVVLLRYRDASAPMSRVRARPACYGFVMRTRSMMAIAITSLVAVVLVIALARRGTPDPAPAETRVSAASAPVTPAAPAPSGASGGMPALPPAVDLDALRKKLPDNLYRKHGVPTDEPKELERRALDDHDWNVRLGKVQSNTASEPEIARYYDHRRQLSHDYAELSRTILTDYGPNLDEQNKGVFGLAAQMNEQRLKQLPLEESRALARHKAYEASKGR